MNHLFEEHDEVVSLLAESFKERFEVLVNKGEGSPNYISHTFPDIILLDKESKTPVFIIEVRRNGYINDCLQQWKNLSNIPATLYVIVPENELNTAKVIATSLGLKCKFGSYKYENNKVNDVRFES